MFCSKCGSEIDKQSKFCSKCGQPVNQTINGAVGLTQSYSGGFTLTVNRAKQWFAVNPSIKMVVDRGAEYKIDNGETLNIPISAGTHNIAFSCSIRNKIVNINVTDNVTLNIKWNRLTGSIEVK